jgi:two-component system sensor histidine kinase KdpD
LHVGMKPSDGDNQWGQKQEAYEVKPHIFEMFYTGNNTIADSHRSLGLGLALCRSIIEAHGGTLVLTDNIPRGCIFTFTLPLSEVILNE